MADNIPQMPSPIIGFWRAFRENRGAVIGLFIVLTMICVAIFADFLAPHDPIEQYRGFTKLPPFGWRGMIRVSY